MTTNQSRSTEPQLNLNNSLNNRDHSTLIEATHDPSSVISTSYTNLCLPVPSSSGVYYDGNPLNDIHNRTTPTTTSAPSKGTVSASFIASNLPESIMLQSTSPRQADASLFQLHSPAVTFSSPAQSPLTPMGTDTDFTYPLSSYSNGSTSSNKSINSTIRSSANATATVHINTAATTLGTDQIQPYQLTNSTSQRFRPPIASPRHVSSSPIQQPAASQEFSSRQPPSATSPAQEASNNVFLMNNETRKILQRNTERLNELEANIQQLVTYGAACDEFLAWLQDLRAYNEHNEPSLMKCAQAVYRSAPDFGPWTGMKILDTINKNSNLLTPISKEKVKSWYRDMLVQQNLLPQAQPPTTPTETSPVATIPISPFTATVDRSPPVTSQPQYSLPSLPGPMDMPPTKDFVAAMQQFQAALQQQHQSSMQMAPQNHHQQPQNRSNASPRQSPHQSPTNRQQQIPNQYVPNRQHPPQQHPPQQQQYVRNSHNSQFIPHQQWLTQAQRPQMYHPNAQYRPPQQQPPRQVMSPGMQGYPGVNQQYVAPRQATQQVVQPNQHIMQHAQRPHQLPIYRPSPVVPSSPLQSPTSATPPVNIPATRPNNAPAPLTAHETLARSNEPLYSHQIRHAVRPLKLKHDVTTTESRFYVTPDDYRQITGNHGLCRPLLKYMLNSWSLKSVESKCEWPEVITIMVNNMVVKCEKKQRVPTADNSVRFVGKDRPYDIKSLLVVGQNVLTIIQDQCACSFLFSVGVYCLQTEWTIAQNLNTCTLDISAGEALIDKLLGNTDTIDSSNPGAGDDDDIEVIQESVKLNLKCPISLTMIKTPVKGVACRHPDCFDLHSFLIMNTAVVAPWKCPFCNTFTPPNTLRRDLFFQHLLTTVPRGAYEVTISGSSSNWRATKIDNDDDDDDDDRSDTPDAKPDRKRIDSLHYTQPDNVVDLVSDSEEEGEVHSIETSSNDGSDAVHSSSNSSSSNHRPLDIHDDDPNRPKRHRPNESSESTSEYHITSDTPSQWISTLQNLMQQPNTQDPLAPP